MCGLQPRAGHAGQYQVNMTALGLTDLGTVLPSAGSTPEHPLAGSDLHPQLFIAEQAGWVRFESGFFERFSIGLGLTIWTAQLARWPNARNLTSWQWCVDSPPPRGAPRPIHLAPSHTPLPL